MFNFLKNKRKNKNNGYSGGDGSSFSSAVIINAENEMVGILNEYSYLSSLIGERGRDWELDSQSLLQKNGKSYDCMKVKLKDGSLKEFYFDISKFHGKF